MIPADFHTHSIASGHGTTHTIDQMAKAAKSRGMTALGISDHGPATPGSCRESYFRTLKLAPALRSGVTVFYGAEANILNEEGILDLSDETLSGLDYVIASLHAPTYRNSAQSQEGASSRPRCQTCPESSILNQIAMNTNAYINAMKNPYIKIIGHPDDAHFPVDARQLVAAAIDYKVILEVNEASLSPSGYRGEARPHMHSLLTLCLKNRHPILLSSDSHGAQDIGLMPHALELIDELQYPRELILNYQPPEAFLLFR